MHYTNMLIPWSGDFKGSRKVLTRSKKIFLSERVLLGSFNPGESISVMLPFVFILTLDVTATRDFEAVNLIGSPAF